MAFRTEEISYSFREILGHAMFEWKIRNISKLQLGYFKFYSPEFLFADMMWRLEMYSSDRINSKTVGWISLYLRQTKGSTLNHLSYTFSIKKSNDMVFKSLKHRNDDGTFGLHGFEEFLRGTDLSKHAKDIAPNDVLTILCTLRLIDGRLVDSEAQASLPTSIVTAQEHFKDLFTKGKHFDVSLRILDIEVSAHRSILACRSRALARMIDDNLIEDNVLTINCCDQWPSASIMKAFLLFLYSGDMNVVCLSNSMGLYKAAVWFEMEDLEEVCVKCMANMTVELFCDIADFAKQEGEQKLFREAKKFFIGNSDAILRTREWTTLERKNPSLTSEMLKDLNNTLKCSKYVLKEILE